MIIYIYNKETRLLFEQVDASEYDDRSVSGEFGTIYVGEDMEFSSLEDLSESLRSLWKRNHPTLQELMGAFLGDKGGYLNPPIIEDPLPPPPNVF